jgi:hypothetical protein
VLAAVKKAMSTYGTRTVTTVGHSLGAAISLLDAVSLSRRLPTGTTVKFFGYGLPRVGNPAFASYVDGSGIQVTHINNELDFGAPSGASLHTALLTALQSQSCPDASWVSLTRRARCTSSQLATGTHVRARITPRACASSVRCRISLKAMRAITTAHTDPYSSAAKRHARTR